MKIHELTDQLTVALTNQENDFVNRYGQSVIMSALSPNDQELDRQLVIKGIYNCPENSNTIILVRG